MSVLDPDLTGICDLSSPHSLFRCCNVWKCHLCFHPGFFFSLTHDTDHWLQDSGVYILQPNMHIKKERRKNRKTNLSHESGHLQKSNSQLVLLQLCEKDFFLNTEKTNLSQHFVILFGIKCFMWIIPNLRIVGPTSSRFTALTCHFSASEEYFRLVRFSPAKPDTGCSPWAPGIHAVWQPLPDSVTSHSYLPALPPTFFLQQSLVFFCKNE